MAKIPFFKISLIIAILLVMVVVVIGYVPDFNLPGGSGERVVVECTSVVKNDLLFSSKFDSVTCSKRAAGFVDCSLPFAIPIVEDEVSVRLQVGSSTVTSPIKILEGQKKAVDLKTCVSATPSSAKVTLLDKGSAVIDSRDVTL